MKRKILFVIIALLICMSLFNAAAFATSEEGSESTTEGLSGSIDKAIDWTYDPDTKTLYITPNANNTVSGNGFTLNGKTLDVNPFKTWRINYSKYADAVETIHRSDEFTSYHSYQHSTSLFANWPNVKTIYLGKLTTISGAWSHQYISDIEDRFPSTISAGAFANNPNLTTVYGYGQTPVEGTINLSQLNFDREGTVTGAYNTRYLLYGCAAESVIMPTSIDNVIWDNSFANCTNLKTIEIPSWVTSIGENAFYGCTNLVGKTFTVGDATEDSTQTTETGLVIPAKVTNIAANAFTNSGVTAIKLLGADTTIETGALPTSTKIYCVSQTQTETFIAAGYDAVYYCETLSYGEQKATLTDSETGETTEYVDYCWTLDTEGVLTITSKKDTTIGTSSTATAFAEWHSIWKNNVKHIVMSTENGLHTISSSTYGIAMLAGYPNLISIDLGNLYRVHMNNSSPTSGAFEGNTSLTTVYATAKGVAKVDGVVNISSIDRIHGYGPGNGRLFAGCTAITDVIFYKTTNSGGAYNLGSNAFDGCTNLETVSLASDITSINDSAFNDCKNLTYVEIPATVTNIGANAFAGSGIESVTFLGTDPTAITIDATAFDNASSLKATVYSEEMKTFLVETHGFTAENVTVNVGGSFGDFTWEINGGVLTISGSGTALAFENEITAETLSNIPWSAYSAQITSVVLEADVTSLCNYAFAGLANCTAIEIPASLTDLSASAVFYGDTALKSVTVSGKTAANGVIDLFNATAVSADLFEGAAITASVYLPKLSDTSFITAWAGDLTALTIVTYPTCDLATAVRANNAVALAYLPESYDPMLRRSGTAHDMKTNGAQFNYSFDDASGMLTFSAPDGGGYSFGINDFTDRTYTTSVNDQGKTVYTAGDITEDGFYAWKNVWKDAVLHATVESDNFEVAEIYCQKNNSAFSNLTNLINVHIEWESYRITGGWPKDGLFQGCTSLTTISYGSDNTIDGEIDLSGLRYLGKVNGSIFKNGTSITKVILPIDVEKHNSSSDTIGIGANMFENCTGLTEIVIPDRYIVINKEAFKGCTNLKRIVIASADCNVANVTKTTFPAGAEIHVFSADIASALEGLGYTNVKDYSNILSVVGTQIREEDYNGLRRIFAFNAVNSKAMETSGYTLEEYGIVVAAASEVEYWGGIDLRLRAGEYVTESTSIKKIPIVQRADGDYVQKNPVRAGSDLDTMVKFQATVVKYNSNHMSDVCMKAYAIYTDNAGNTIVIYSNTYIDEDDNIVTDAEGNIYMMQAEKHLFNLYDTTIQMLKEGALTSAIDEKAVWNTLLQGADLTDERELSVGDYDGITVAFVKDNTDGNDSVVTYIPVVRSENGVAITDDMVTAAIALAPEGATLGEAIEVLIANQDSKAPEYVEPTTYLGTAARSDAYPRWYTGTDDQIYGAQHLQGMTMDDEGNIYYSFTGLIVKVSPEGEDLGVYKISQTLTDKTSVHMGNVYWHDGKIYVAIGFNNRDAVGNKVYIGVLDDSIFNGYVEDTEENPIMLAMNVGEISNDRYFTDSDGNQVAYFGGGGIDSITVGTLPGKGYIKEDGTVVTDNEMYLVLGRGGGNYDEYRYDDDNKELMFFDFDDMIPQTTNGTTNANLLPLTYARASAEDNTTINKKYGAFVYAGYNAYSIQVLTYDKSTGDYLIWAYDRATNCNEFPDYTRFVIDGSKKLYLDDIEVGQSVPETSEYYAKASDYASYYKDTKDIDGDGDTNEPMRGWHATLKCTCELGDIDLHEAVAYGETGYEAKICGFKNGIQGHNGCISLGNDYYYIARSLSDSDLFSWESTDKDGNTVQTTQTGYYAESHLYSISKYFGAWEFTRIN